MFKDKLKKIRTSKGLTQAQLAEKLFVSRSAIAKWEQGRGLPQEEMLDSISEFFNVDRIHLYDKDEPNKLIEKLSKRSRIYLLLGIILAIALITTLIIIISSNKKFVIVRDEFFSDEYIEEMHLEGLKNIKTDSANSLLYKCTYYADIDSLNQFEEYAEYVYTFLLNSFEITYVGFGIDVALYGMFEDRDPDDLRIFIKRSDKLFDYATYQENSVSYKFYYLTSNHVQHEKGKQIDPYVISLNYSLDSSKLAWGLKIDAALEVKNFYMSIYKTSISESEKYKSGFYVFDDYFYLEETELNNENILDYFDIDISKSSNEYRYQIVPKNFIFKYYFKAHLTIYESENIIESKEQIITRGFNTIKLMSPQIIYDNEAEDIINSKDLIIENGYFYQAMPITSK